MPNESRRPHVSGYVVWIVGSLIVIGLAGVFYEGHGWQKNVVSIVLGVNFFVANFLYVMHVARQKTPPR